MKSYFWKIQVVVDIETGEIMEGYSSTESVLIGLNMRTSCKPPSEAGIVISEYCTTDFKNERTFLYKNFFSSFTVLYWIELLRLLTTAKLATNVSHVFSTS
jgi:hypothetical protein